MIFAIFVSVLGSLCYVYTSFYSTSMCSLCCCEYKHTHNGRGLSYVFFLGLRIVSFPPRAFLHAFGIRIRINCLEWCEKHKDNCRTECACVTVCSICIFFLFFLLLCWMKTFLQFGWSIFGNRLHAQHPSRLSMSYGARMVTKYLSVLRTRIRYRRDKWFNPRLNG